MNRQTYEKLIAEDLEWLLKQPHCSERMHIKAVLAASAGSHYKGESDHAEIARLKVELNKQEKNVDDMMNMAIYNDDRRKEASSLFRAEHERAENCLRAAEALWGVVANAGGGNWQLESVEWRNAAARARELYRTALARKTKAIPPCTCGPGFNPDCEHHHEAGATTERQALGNLLATLNGDGGQRQDEVGVKQAAEEGLSRVLAMLQVMAEKGIELPKAKIECPKSPTGRWKCLGSPEDAEDC